MSDSPRVIGSLGAGVQSSTLALMAARGELPASYPRPEVWVFADTGWEPLFVYSHLEWLTTELAHLGVPVVTVRAKSANGLPVNIKQDVLDVVRGWRERVATPPVFVKGSLEFNPSPIPALQQRFVRHVGGAANFVVMPIFARTFNGKKGQLRRQCTGDYKIEPIYAWLKPYVGRRKGQRKYAGPKGNQRVTGPFAEMWIGISSEENQKRCKPSQEPWVDNRWPLRELGISRKACDKWAWDTYQRVFPKSACVGCPYHDNGYWAWLRQYHDDAWQEAVEFDRSIRQLPMIQGECYLHSSCVPLDQVLLTPADRGQTDFLALLDQGDECEFF